MIQASGFTPILDSLDEVSEFSVQLVCPLHFLQRTLKTGRNFPERAYYLESRGTPVASPDGRVNEDDFHGFVFSFGLL